MADSDDALTQLHAHVAAMAARLTPRERLKLTWAIARRLRRRNVERIGQQKNPDGSAFEPRKRPPLRSKSGRIKRRAAAMFQKLRRREYLVARATPGEASVGFPNPQVSRIAYVHQLGLRDRVRRRPGAAEVQYPARVLLGFGPDEEEEILDMALEHLES